MTKTYAESSSQTTQVDPDNHLKNYSSLKPSSRNENQTPEDSKACIEQADLKDDSAESDSESSADQQRQLERRLNPTTSKDFEALQTELLQWRKREERKVTITARSEEHRQELKKNLLKKEAHLLRKIDQLKNTAKDKSRKDRIESMMAEMAQPQQWEVSDGGVIGVDTPETCRARELKEMYDDLNQKVEKATTRIEVLERIKVFVEKIDQCGLAKDVGSLLERELQMLHRGTDLGPELMNGLRTRLANQFTKLVTRLNSEADDSTQHVTSSKAKYQLHQPDAVDSQRDVSLP